MSKSILVHLSLGSNLGNRIFFLNHACKELEMMSLQNFRVSHIFESKPLLKMQQPNYYNIVVCGLTYLGPFELLKKCVSVCVCFIYINLNDINSLSHFTQVSFLCD